MSVTPYGLDSPIQLAEIAALIGKDPAELGGYVLVVVHKNPRPPALLTDTSDMAQVIKVLGHVISAVAGAMTALVVREDGS